LFLSGQNANAVLTFFGLGSPEDFGVPLTVGDVVMIFGGGGTLKSGKSTSIISSSARSGTSTI
jgi:hypothetical protein